MLGTYIGTQANAFHLFGVVVDVHICFIDSIICTRQKAKMALAQEHRIRTASSNRTGPCIARPQRTPAAAGTLSRPVWRGPACACVHPPPPRHHTADAHDVPPAARSSISLSLSRARASPSARPHTHTHARWPPAHPSCSGPARDKTNPTSIAEKERKRARGGPRDVVIVRVPLHRPVVLLAWNALRPAGLRRTRAPVRR